MQRFVGNRLVPVVGALLLVLVIAGGVLLVRQRSAYAFNGVEYPTPQPAAVAGLVDHDGQPFSFAEQGDVVQVLHFGYTTCPDFCPTTLLDFGVVKDDLGADAARTKFLMVTIDPERDTVERLKEYMGFFDPDFVGVRGDAAPTKAAMQAFGVHAERVDTPESSTGYLMAHTGRIFVIDRDGRLRLSYPYETDPALIAADVRHLLKG